MATPTCLKCMRPGVPEAPLLPCDQCDRHFHRACCPASTSADDIWSCGEQDCEGVARANEEKYRMNLDAVANTIAGGAHPMGGDGHPSYATTTTTASSMTPSGNFIPNDHIALLAGVREVKDYHHHAFPTGMPNVAPFGYGVMPTTATSTMTHGGMVGGGGDAAANAGGAAAAAPVEDDNPVEYDDGQPCTICGEWRDWASMLLCDMCDRAFHMRCLRPKVDVVPPGDWFCGECSGTDDYEMEEKRWKMKRMVDKGILSPAALLALGTGSGRKRKRGRPRKYPGGDDDDDDENEEEAKERRRKRKAAALKAAASISGSPSAPKTSGRARRRSGEGAGEGSNGVSSSEQSSTSAPPPPPPPPPPPSQDVGGASSSSSSSAEGKTEAPLAGGGVPVGGPQGAANM